MFLRHAQVAVNMATFLVIGRCDAVTYQVRCCPAPTPRDFILTACAQETALLTQSKRYKRSLTPPSSRRPVSDACPRPIKESLEALTVSFL